MGNRAVRWAAPQRLEVVDVADPADRPDELVIRVDAVGICGTDLHSWRGTNPRVRPGTVLGHEFGGTVVHVGAQVDGWAVGDTLSVDPNRTCGQCGSCRAGLVGRCPQRVAAGIHCDGGLTRFLALAPRHAVRLSPTAGPADGPPAADHRYRTALVEPLAVGLHAAARAGVVPGSRVGVIGAGPVGLACAWAARRAGAATVTVVELDPGRRRAAAQSGLSTLAPAELDTAGSGPGWDATLDAVGSAGTAASALRATRRGGTVCVVGLAADAWTVPAEELIRGEKTVVGAFCYARDELAAAAAELDRGAAGPFTVDPVLGLDAVPDLFTALGAGHRPPGKPVVIL